MDCTIEVTLINGVLKPNHISLRENSQQPEIASSILLKISNEYPSTLSSMAMTRKYIFAIQELDQETEPLSEGDQHLFDCFKECPSGIYHLSCLNYPKLTCEIEVSNDDFPLERKSNTMISLSELEAVEEEKEEENKEEIKDGSDESKELAIEISKSENPLGTPNNAEIEDFDKILSNESIEDETIENRYLRYFQDEFKIWRNFFEERPIVEASSENDIEVSTPEKEKPKSEHRKNSDADEEKIENWSKRETYSPNLKFTLSCGSPSNENLSESEKEKSFSILHSHQDNYHVDEELEKEPKTMKKTNSEYRLSIQDLTEIKDSETDTASKSKKNKKLVTGTFMQWLNSWAEYEEPLLIAVKDDDYVIKQWIGHVRNKYRINKFVHN